MPFDRPLTTQCNAPVDQVHVLPPGDEVTLYAVIAAPPVEGGACQDTVACALPPTAETVVGALGTVAGTTALDADDAVPVPTLFVATTLKV